MTIRFQLLTTENTGLLYGLYRSVYGRSRARGYFENKYAVIYPDYPPVAFLAFSGDETNDREAIGFYGAIPCFLSCGKERIMAAQCADAMTHPAFRRQGLFLALARQTMDACLQSGIRLLFGFPNQYSLPGFLDKLGWEKGQQMDCFRLPVTGIPFRKIFRRLPVTGSAYDRYAGYVLDRHNEEAGKRKYPSEKTTAGLSRDEAWIKYKRSGGAKLLTINGETCWLRIGEELLAGDITGNGASLDRNLDRLKKIARQLGLTSIRFHCCTGTALHRALLDRVAPLPSFTTILKDFGAGIVPGRLVFDFADMDTF